MFRAHLSAIVSRTVVTLRRGKWYSLPYMVIFKPLSGRSAPKTRAIIRYL